MEVTNRATFMQKYDNGGLYLSKSKKDDGKIGYDELLEAVDNPSIPLFILRIIGNYQILSNIPGNKQIACKLIPKLLQQYREDAIKAGLDIKDAFGMLVE